MERVVSTLMDELGRAFDLETRLGQGTLGAAVERRIRALDLSGPPEWGTDGSLTQLARDDSRALDFYYRPHLFPGMDDALRLGHRLQFDLLPRTLPVGSPVRVAAVLESYCHLSGDLLGWRKEGDDLLLWIADVSGHGVRAGLAAATLYFILESVPAGLSPAGVAARVNQDMLAARNPEDPAALFATAVWLRAGADGTVTYASAGHNSVLLGKAGGELQLLPSTGKPLGLVADENYGERRIAFDHGDSLCLYTDGVVEATDPAGEEFGLARLTDLRRRFDDSPLAFTRLIYHSVREHQSTKLFEDDLTFMVLERARREPKP